MAPPIRVLVFVALLAISIGLYRARHSEIVLNLGTGPVIQPLEDFPGYRCHRVRHPLLESCEDLWLDSSNRKLYAACTNPNTRVAWSPGGNTYDLPARAAGGGGTDHITVLDIDQPGADGLYGVRQLNFRDREGNIQELDLHGFDARVIDQGRRLRFWLVNHRPPLDVSTGKPLLDATKVGANSTIEVYDLDLDHGDEKSNELVHVKTIVSTTIISPNNLVVLDDQDDRGGFLFTNDHSTKISPFRAEDLSGSISYCRTDTGQCHFAATENFSFPNGITRDPSSGLIYVAHSGRGTVSVHRLEDDEQLVQINEVALFMGVDNLSIDPDENIFAAAIPDPHQFLRAFHDPYGTDAPSTVLMIRKKRGDIGAPPGKQEYEVIKIVEDAQARVLPTTTTAVHDPVSGLLFLGALSSPFIGVCERQK